MNEKYDQKYEDHIKLLADHRLESKNFKVFDFRSRAVKRQSFPDLAERGRSDNQNALVLISGDGEVIVLTEECERMLYAISKRRFS